MDSFWHDLATAFALLLILEGLLPTLSPRAWLKAMQDAARLGPRGIRLVGIICLLSGAVMLQVLL
jgi:uncharacterized protein YjeT (DUF2065 family)